MKNKATLVLIEHLVMLLVFVLAATVCVRIFVLSEKLSRQYEATDRASLEAQNAAELLKKSGIDGYVKQTGAVQTEENKWVVFYDSDWKQTEEKTGKFTLTVEYSAEETGFLWQADIIVLSESGSELFRIPAAGQK